jgi:hypothetical protein
MGRRKGKRKGKKRPSTAINVATTGATGRESQQQSRQRERSRQKVAPTRPFAQRFLARTWQRFVALIVVLSAVAGLASAWLSFQARVSVTTADTLDPSVPFSTEFTVTNAGPLPIYDTDIRCTLGDVLTGPKAIPTPNWRSSVSYFTSDLSNPQAGKIGTLQAGESTQDSEFCAINHRSTIYADVAITVVFRPKFWPWLLRERFRFVTVRNPDGHLMWSAKPLPVTARK